ncbi:hypothetical protein BaRGS_00000777 [Batillaria attramentaria]|uniref:Uncharacterized protein n=1 Tax=Batillaria attramentaria TaxID=370345 RepID=A0ABD0M7X4_9CAEN
MECRSLMGSIDTANRTWQPEEYHYRVRPAAAISHAGHRTHQCHQLARTDHHINSGISSTSELYSLTKAVVMCVHNMAGCQVGALDTGNVLTNERKCQKPSTLLREKHTRHDVTEFSPSIPAHKIEQPVLSKPVIFTIQQAGGVFRQPCRTCIAVSEAERTRGFNSSLNRTDTGTLSAVFIKPRSPAHGAGVFLEAGSSPWFRPDQSAYRHAMALTYPPTNLWHFSED